eukprot:GILK01013765.1.p1 GENE.GILK01013765.1~~GILK01013765.1.p1  ORF type:complete len:587 (+),score=81.25 GILK01013765.1:42-1802(+)
MSKKLLNDASTSVLEMLHALTMSSVGLTRMDGFPDIKVVLRSDYQQVKQKQVTIISGGGSGHEPAHAGYVGAGMLTAAVAGDIFASPSSKAVLAALRAVTGPHGCLVIVKNYTGDRLHFGAAVEQAKAEGFNVEMVIVGDDCAIETPSLAGKRGLAGTVLVHKVVGAAAELGLDLQQVVHLANVTAMNVATVGLALTTCTLPGAASAHRLADDEVELGLGIHGEPGVTRTKMQPADDLVDAMLEKIIAAVKRAPGWCQGATSPTRDVCLLVNNLGSSSSMELAVVTGRALQTLQLKHGVRVVRLSVGSFMTSLNMAGVSLTVLTGVDQLLPYLDAETSASGWQRLLTPCCEPKLVPVPVPVHDTGELIASGCEWSENEQEAVMKASTAACVAILQAEPQLTEWDTAIGDGDCGLTLSKGANAVLDQLKHGVDHDPSTFLLKLSHVFESSMGGSSGALYCIMAKAAAGSMLRSSRQLDTAARWMNAFVSGVAAVLKYGRAPPKSRTMNDALVPAADILEQRDPSMNALQCLESAVQAAEVGAESTRHMPALAGRSSYLSEEVLKDVPDPGAKACAAWLRAVVDSLHR